jgi:hypothetical protein
MTAQETYDERFNQAIDDLNEITHLLHQHVEKQRRQPENWAFAGDLGKVHSDFQDIIRFLSSGTPIDDFFTPDMTPDTVEAESEYFGLMADNAWMTGGG